MNMVKVITTELTCVVYRLRELNDRNIVVEKERNST